MNDAVALRSNVVKLSQVPENREDIIDVEIDYTEELKKLGFTTAVKKLDLAQKMKIAYGKYGFVTQEKINIFNDKLRKETLKEDSMSRTFKRLVFIDVSNYAEIPPPHVLRNLKEAISDGCFDKFEIAKIEWIKEIKDPILFGRIEGCNDRFFIAQWDDDVKVEDILLVQEEEK